MNVIRSALLVSSVVTSSALVLAAVGCTSSQIHAAPGARASSTQPASGDAQRSELANFREVITTQKTPVWCWAASTEMVHRFYGRTDITQEQLAAKLTGAKVGDDAKKLRAAGLRQIMLALCPEYATIAADRWGNALADGEVEFDATEFVAGQIAPWSAGSDDLIEAISSGNPAIIGLRGENQQMGHAVVVYAVSYDLAKRNVAGEIFGSLAREVSGGKTDQFGMKGPAKYRLYEINYADPMDGKRYKLNAESLKKRIDFIMTRDRAREILAKELGAVR